jgi:hypothetical protein
MSLEPIREDERVVEAPGATGETVTPETTDGTATPETGSVWWAEMLFGSVCCLTAVVFALAHTSVGPFAEITVVYGTVPTLLYLVVATVLGVGFLRSGLRRPS